ncbi:MAG: 3-deoxy-7-phosphoheptulonate synthase [Bacillota bacterium]
MDFKYVGKHNSMPKTINVKNIIIGGNEFLIIAGPCAVESEKQIVETAFSVKKAGAKILRGGAYKPRTSPYSFQGLGEEGLKLLCNAGHASDMPVISEVMDPRDVSLAYKYIDIFQIGSRNMQNFSLLREVGKTDKPVMLKRGMAASIEDWLSAAEYIACEGNQEIILCERGIRTFENYTRNTLDLMAIPILKQLTNLPIIVDPSHGTGRRELVPYASTAALAIGAHGIMIEVHPNPDEALSDGRQSLDFPSFEKMAKRISTLKDCLDTLL